MIVSILLCVAVIVISVVVTKPFGWISLGLAVLALLAAVTNFRI